MAKGKRKCPEGTARSPAEPAFWVLLFALITPSRATDRGLTRQLPPPPEQNQKDNDDVK